MDNISSSDIEKIISQSDYLINLENEEGSHSLWSDDTFQKWFDKYYDRSMVLCKYMRILDSGDDFEMLSNELCRLNNLYDRYSWYCEDNRDVLIPSKNIYGRESNSKTNMIWGSEWTQVMIWMKDIYNTGSFQYGYPFTYSGR